MGESVPDLANLIVPSWAGLTILIYINERKRCILLYIPVPLNVEQAVCCMREDCRPINLQLLGQLRKGMELRRATIDDDHVDIDDADWWRMKEGWNL